MQVRRGLPLTVWLVAVWLHGCAGGSGSSGFDVSGENAAIRQALTEQRCVVRDGLTICPAGSTAGPGSPTPTPTATPPPTARATATTTAAVVTPAATATRVSGTPTPTPTALSPVATATPRGGVPGVDTALDGATAVACVQGAPDAPCSFVLPFAPFGFPADAVYAVAVRVDGSGRWSIGPALAANGPTGSSFDAPVAVPSTVSPGVTVQLAVLVFVPPLPAIPEDVQQLADSGASFAFVTPELAVHAQTTEPAQSMPAQSPAQSP